MLNAHDTYGWISGIISLKTTNSIAPAAKESANGNKEWDNWTKQTPSRPAKTSTKPLSCPYLDGDLIRFRDTLVSAHQKALKGPTPKDRNGRLIANPKKCISIGRVLLFSLCLSKRIGMHPTRHLPNKRRDCTNFTQCSCFGRIWIRIAFAIHWILDASDWQAKQRSYF